jgi:uncharacterized protein
VPASEGAPTESTPVPLPMFPLSSVLFPHGRLTLHVFEARYRQLTADCLAASRELGVVLITRGSEVGGGDQRAAVGTVARIEHALPMADGRWFLILEGVRRIRVVTWLPDSPYPRALVQAFPDAGAEAEGAGHRATVGGAEPSGAGGAAVDRATAALRMARGLASEAGDGPALSDEALGEDRVPHRLVWRLCAEAPVGPLDRQRLLEAPDLEARFDLVAELCSAVVDDLRRLLAGG